MLILTRTVKHLNVSFALHQGMVIFAIHLLLCGKFLPIVGLVGGAEKGRLGGFSLLSAWHKAIVLAVPHCCLTSRIVIVCRGTGGGELEMAKIDGFVLAWRDELGIVGLILVLLVGLLVDLSTWFAFKDWLHVIDECEWLKS